jgi:hypothetical protein
MKLKIDYLIDVAPIFKYSTVYFLINNNIIDEDLRDFGLNYIKIYTR